jgi:hypothetical protein
MAIDTTPNSSIITQYLHYKPRSPDKRIHELWTTLVQEPVYDAVHRYQPVLKAHGMMDQVFRFQDLDKLVTVLESSDRKKARENLAARPGRF